MIRLVEQKLEHTFEAEWTASKYDEWPFYRKHFQWSWAKDEPGNKSVDFVAIDPAGDSLWLIELKDYRLYQREKEIPLPDEIAFKVRDSLAGLFAAAKHDAHHAHAADAQRSLQAKRIRVVLIWSSRGRRRSCSHAPTTLPTCSRSSSSEYGPSTRIPWSPRSAPRTHYPGRSAPSPERYP